MGTHDNRLVLHQLGRSELSALPPKWSPTTIPISNVEVALGKQLNAGAEAYDAVTSGMYPAPEGAILVRAAFCQEAVDGWL